jgi:MFS family permease
MKSNTRFQAMAGSASEAAFRFVLAMGIVNLFADTTYEGGGSINGPFLGSLGASAAAVSIIAGAGEFLGYSLRSVSGYIADRTGKHWPMTFIGYSINLLAVPAMALAANWQVAALLILAERTGRAIRKPTVEAMLSYTTGKVGRGWVYGLNTALDETGATIGPLFMALVLALHGNYRTAYSWLLVSSLLALLSLGASRLIFPLPSEFEQGGGNDRPESFTTAYWLYMIAGALFAAGLMSFELVSFHLYDMGIVSQQLLPVFLAIATIVGIAASLIMGRLYDRKGIAVVVVAVCLSAAFSPLVFLGGFSLALVGILLWGIGYATQDTLLKALIAGVAPRARRNFGFGVFYLGYGAGWLVGSIVAGLLYEHSRVALVTFAVVVQLASAPFFILGAKRSDGPA